MKIEICGPGCAKCHATVDNVRRVVQELGLEDTVELEEIKDIVTISKKGVFLTPAVVIDGVKVSEGRIARDEEIKKWLEERR
ncbi:MAG: TM0996/MTH895 family glutaredoxin-like protein [Dehalococcoidia bacterium]|nr:TM0996/MTH895 family glutaredoxin-like protein [Dehalococcoidia bacterium]